MDGSQGEVRRLIAQFYEELWNRWNDGLVESVLADDFRFRGSLGQETTGLVEWRAYRDLIRRGSSDFHNEVREVVVDGDRAAALLRYTGTHDGTIVGLPATHRHFGYDGAAFFTAAGGRLVEAWVLGDVAGLRAQLEGKHH